MEKQEAMEQLTTIQKLLSDVQKDWDYIHKALDNLERLQTGVAGDITGQARAIAIQETVKQRETTNQQLISVYEKMYNDLRGVLFDIPTESTEEEQA